MKAFQHLRRRLVERRPGAERRVCVRCAGEQRRAQLRIQYVARLGQILRHLLLDCPPFLVPVALGVEHGAHSQRLDAQRDIEILGRHGEQVLRETLARVGVEIAADDAADGGELIGRQPGTAAEHHVLLGMRRAGETHGRLIGSDQVVDRGGDHRRQCVAHDDHLQPIGQRCAHWRFTGSGVRAGIRHSNKGKDQASEQRTGGRRVVSAGSSMHGCVPEGARARPGKRTLAIRATICHEASPRRRVSVTAAGMGAR